jgi:hypothetical protein
MREALRLVDLAIVDLELNHKNAFSLPLIYLRLVQRDLMSQIKKSVRLPKGIDEALTESGLGR